MPIGVSSGSAFHVFLSTLTPVFGRTILCPRAGNP